jgi:hypothetical protein
MNAQSNFAGTVDLLNAKVTGVVNLSGSDFSGTLSLVSLQVDGDLFMDRGHFGEVILRGTKVGGQIMMSGSTFSKDLIIRNADVAHGLSMTDAATFQHIQMRSVKVSDHLGMYNAKFMGLVEIEGLQLKGNAIMRNSTFLEDVVFRLSTVEGSLTLAGSELRWVDLSGTTITGELTLAYSPIKWERDSTFILQNTVVGTIADSKECWPSDLTLVLGGFAYQRWGGGLYVSPSQSPKSAMSHPAQWFSNSLSNDRSYSPRPYEQLATVLRTMGYSAYAEDVLYQGKMRALLEEPAPWYSKAAQTVFMAVIGFGHRLQYAVVWTIFFIVLGAWIVTRTPEGRHEGVRFALAYSVETLLPLVKFRDKDSGIDFEGRARPARYYFYFHRAMGFVLASFLIAALSGLTK